jgi:MtrB/PioB family decaheme-associated outer membrane protein
MSNRHYQLELAGDYRISTAQRLHVGYEHEHTARWCDNALANNARGAGSAAYYTVNSCAQVPVSKEDKLSAVYKIRATETIDFNAGYAISRRQSDVNSSFYNPMQGNSQGYENYGYVAFFEASRRENMVKTGVNWQATEKFSVGVNGRYVRDDYDSALGVQDGNAVSANLDATYAFSENYVVSAYTSWQRRKRDLLSANGRNAVAPLPNLWTNNLTDQDNTAGISAKQKGFMGGKLEFSEDLTYSLAKSRYSTAGVTSYAAALAVGATGSTPDILTELTQLRLAGNYQLSHVSKVIMGYTFQHLNSNDYMYNGLQYGYTATSMLPSNQQAPNYIINTIYAAYQYSFR